MCDNTTSVYGWTMKDIDSLMYWLGKPFKTITMMQGLINKYVVLF